MRRTCLSTATLVATTLLAGPALAHTGGPVSGLAAGLGHPFLGLDHMLAMAAVGVWSAAGPRHTAWQAPALFVTLLAVGSVIGMSGVAASFVEPGVLASVMVLGTMILAVGFVPQGAGLVAIGGFALLHGHAHGTEAAGAASAYMAGFMIASAVLHLSGYGLGRLLDRIRYGLPAAGLGLAAAGLALIGS